MDSIAEEVLPDEEYDLLVSVLRAAEERDNVVPRLALSCYLSEDRIDRSKLVILIQPRPTFPPEYYDEICVYSTTSSAGVASRRTIDDSRLSRALAFDPSRFSLARRIIESRWRVPLDFPVALQALAIKVEELSLGHSFTHMCVEQTLPPALWGTLFKYQCEGVMRAILKLNGRTLIADEMGMGKTLQALVIAEFYRLQLTSAGGSKTIVLVLCPAALRAPWASAVAKFVPRAHAGIADSPRQLVALLRPRAEKRDLWDGPDVTSHVVVSYDTLCRVDDPHLLSHNRHIVIVDECHMLRNITTLRARSALPFILSARYRILVSGTPALGHPSDIYCILKALLQDSCGDEVSEDGGPVGDNSQSVPNSNSADGFLSLDLFLKRYSATGGPGWNGGGIVRDYELNALLASIMIRRTKAEVRLNLPPKHRTRVMFTHSANKLRDISDQFKKISDADQRHGTQSNRASMKQYTDTLFTVMYNLTGDLKVRCALFRLAQLVRGLRRRRIIVFAHHVNVLSALEAFVREQHWDYVRVDSHVASEQQLAHFQSGIGNNKDVRIALLSLNVAAVGINLNKADTVLFAELSWTPSILAQAEDRAHRIGRIGPLHVEYLLIPGSLDDIMVQKLQGKAQLTTKITDGHHRVRYGRAVESTAGCDAVSACESEIEISENDVDEFMTSYLNNENNSQENIGSQASQLSSA